LFEKSAFSINLDLFVWIGFCFACYEIAVAFDLSNGIVWWWMDSNLLYFVLGWIDKVRKPIFWIGIIESVTTKSKAQAARCSVQSWEINVPSDINGNHSGEYLKACAWMNAIFLLLLWLIDMDLNSATCVAPRLNMNLTLRDIKFTIRTKRSCCLALIGKFGEEGYNRINNSNEPLLLAAVEKNAIHIYKMV
jgi:hypothetical protein